jgi:hypothetical protein
MSLFIWVGQLHCETNGTNRHWWLSHWQSNLRQLWSCTQWKTSCLAINSWKNVLQLFYICFTFVLHLFYICFTFVLHLFYICFTFVLHLFTFVLHLLYICFTFVLHLFYICFTFSFFLEFQWLRLLRTFAFPCNFNGCFKSNFFWAFNK